MSIQFIRYDTIGGDVNDAITILSLEHTPEDVQILKSGDDAAVLAYIDSHVGLQAGVTIDNGGDGGNRIELNDKHGVPCGAVAWRTSLDWEEDSES